MLELGVIEWGMLILVCISIGISKTALSSLSILSVTMIVMTFPAKTAVGLILPLLIIGDLIALLYYRQHVIWRYLIKLVPWVFAGIIIGYFILGYITDEHLKPLIGWIILLLIILNLIRDISGQKFIELLPESKVFTIFMGILSGFTTMVGNAAGPIMAIYLLMIGLGKKDLVGTAAIFFFVVNILKVPFYIHLNMINWESLLINLIVFPAIFIGAFIGIKILNHPYKMV